MKLSTKEDVEAPVDFVFEQVSDFQVFERAALRRGADVQRIDLLSRPEVGMIWEAEFKFRGRKRQANIELIRFDPNSGLECAFQTQLLRGSLKVDVAAMSRTRTRLALKLDVSPRNLAARLLIQSLKFARSRVEKKFKYRVAHFARKLEERHKRVA